MNVDQSSSSSLSRTTTNAFHEQQLRKEETHFEHLTERSVPESYHHSSYEYLSPGHSTGDVAPDHPFNSSSNLSAHQRDPSPSQKHSNKHLPSTSHSPNSYRYQPAALLDESSTIAPYSMHRSTQGHPPVSSSSLSAYVPQHPNPNRHSLLPTTSDDSGNESSLQYQQQLTNNHTHFVVVAIDFGTTFSGYAFAFTRDIDSILMMRKVDGNDPGSFVRVRVDDLTLLPLTRCNQSKNADDDTSHPELRIPFVRLLRSRFLPRSRSRRSEALALLREVQDASALHPSECPTDVLILMRFSFT